MNINTALLKLATQYEDYLAADRQRLVGPDTISYTPNPLRASMGALREFEGQDPGLNDRINMTESERFADPAGSGVLDNMKDFFSTPHGQVAAAAGLLGLGALSHHALTKHRRQED